MAAKLWNLDASDGQLLVKTGVTGRAAKLGHRLIIAMNSWQATVTWTGGAPTGVDLVVDVDSLEVMRGEGGAKGLSGPEKRLARSNALGILDADRFPQIHFSSDDVDKTDDGYRIVGSLQIHGTDRDCVVDLH
ncbi:MAG: YceI family protein, partial [Mycobacterium sp.]